MLAVCSNTWNYITKLNYVYKSYISNIYEYTGFSIKLSAVVDMTWDHTKPLQIINIYIRY